MSVSQTTPSEENYLEWIYRLAGEGPVRPAQLADELGVKRPSATKAVGLLAQKGLVNHEPYGDVQLTEAGKRLAEAITRRDRCLTELLVTVLGMDRQAADPEVHRLEHVLSDDVLRRLEALVGFASSSEAWLKRLHLRIAATRDTPCDTDAIQLGRYEIHRGTTREKDA